MHRELLLMTDGHRLMILAYRIVPYARARTRVGVLR